MRVVRRAMARTSDAVTPANHVACWAMDLELGFFRRSLPSVQARDARGWLSPLLRARAQVLWWAVTLPERWRRSVRFVGEVRPATRAAAWADGRKSR
jgi:hypothetical protein